MTTVDFPAKLQFLFQPMRYKVAYGGRGSGKSWGFARALLIQGMLRPIRVLCTRELQNSIADSVHKLLEDQIYLMGMQDFYKIQNAYIIGQNGTEFSFAGLRHHIGEIKSKEGIDICWVEEGQSASRKSWDTLIPTIRKEKSEIWVSFNPDLETDETYVRFVLNQPTNAIVEKVNWRDNQWFTKELHQEMLDLKARDYDAYLHIWEGHCISVVEGAIYANELRKATEEGRICRVPYDPSFPVHTFWDLGRSDTTAIWFGQRIGFDNRFIDYYENSGFALDHYLKVVQGRGYVLGQTWLPHDARAQRLGSKKSIEEQTRDVGLDVRIVPRLSVEDGINAARQFFVNSWFDEAKTSDGLNALRHYRYGISSRDNRSKGVKPLHNWASNGADSYRYAALALTDRPTRRRKGVLEALFPKLSPDTLPAEAGWMR